MAENKATPAAKQSAQAPAPARSWFAVQHTGVGRWVQGDVISSDDLFANVHNKEGQVIGTVPVDIDRLLSLGAIVPTQEPIKDVAPSGDGEE